MKQANFSVKFGDPTYANIPSYFKIQVELNQDKVTLPEPRSNHTTKSTPPSSRNIDCPWS